ncbi:RNA polymerase sigma factor [Parasphingorhabdus sp.]|uniref:RNA polymerase sigma factor n=1 Tax=Parasphingorhabdus sp. TaxID=2709688 RepID=UPI003D2950D0
MDQPDSDDPDSTLVSRAVDGDKRAFGVLMQRHSPRLLGIAYKTLHNSDEAQDAVQEAMASAWFKLDQFDQNREISPWLARIALNKCRDHLRRRKWRRFFEFGGGEEYGVETSDEAPDQSSDLEARQLLALMEEKISALPHSLREPFILVTYDERSQAETAMLLGISEKAVETRIYRARNKLREAFKKIEG